MANERIGTAPCPLCSKAAGVTVSKAGLVVLTCNSCHCQLFTRSDVSDRHLRDMVKPAEKPAPVAEPEPVAPALPGNVEPAAPPVAAMPPPASEPKKSFWDIY